MQYYEISITSTGKAMGPTDEDYRIFNNETVERGSLAEVKAYLKDRYGNCKRVKMYRDMSEYEDPRQSGWIYCFNVDQWHQQDWVEVRRIEALIVIP